MSRAYRRWGHVGLDEWPAYLNNALVQTHASARLRLEGRELRGRTALSDDGRRAVLRPWNLERVPCS